MVPAGVPLAATGQPCPSCEQSTVTGPRVGSAPARSTVWVRQPGPDSLSSCPVGRDGGWTGGIDKAGGVREKGSGCGGTRSGREDLLEPVLPVSSPGQRTGDVSLPEPVAVHAGSGTAGLPGDVGSTSLRHLSVNTSASWQQEPTVLQEFPPAVARRPARDRSQRFWPGADKVKVSFWGAWRGGSPDPPHSFSWREEVLRRVHRRHSLKELSLGGPMLATRVLD